MRKAHAHEQVVQDLPRLGETTFKAIFDMAGTAIIVFDLDGRIREFNPAAERLHGCSRQDVVGKRYMGLFVPKETRNSLRSEMRKIAARDIGHDLEISIHTADGQTRIISWNGTRLRDDEGTATGMIAIGQDITARKQTELALGESERRFRDLADAAPILVWMSDIHYKCTYVNQAWLDFTGLTADALLGDAWANLIHPDDHKLRLPEYLDAIERHVEFKMDHRLRSADGTYRWIYGTSVPRTDTKGEFAGFVGCSIDITDRRRAEEKLRQTNEALEGRVVRRTAELSASVRELRSEIAERKDAASRLESVMRNSPDFIFQTDRDGRISFLNRRLHGDVDDVLNTSMYAWVEEEAHPRLDTALRRVFEEGVADRYEARVTGNGTAEKGTLFVFDISPVILDEHVQSAVVNARDIGAQEQAERRLREIESELAHALRMSTMGEMAVAIAHELHQPLAAVVNYSGACTELASAGGARGTKLLSYLDQISSQTLRAGEIIRRLRGFIEKKEPERGPLTMKSVIEQTAPLLKAEAKHHGVALEFALANDPPTVLGDRIQLQQIIVNLVKNAVEATRDNDENNRRVRIETSAPTDGSIVEVRVSDTGPGLSGEELRRAFEPFYSTKPTGMGFGLSISRSIAEAHGGSLVARDAPDEGATFCLALPTMRQETSREY